MLYDPGSRPIWAAGTNGNPGARLVMQDDSNLVIYRSNNSPAWASNTVQRAVPKGPAAAGTQMLPGQTLAKDRPINSANGRYTFVFQGDGNLVLYKNYPNHPRRALWASGTNGRPAVVCIMQGDGNLVIYDSDANALWASGSHGHPGSHLIVQDDGNVVIYQPNNAPVWATNTVQATLPTGPAANGATMRPGETLPVNHPINSASGRYTFVFQGDGNLVLYDADAHPIWASNTNGHPGSRLVVQDDGSVVIYQPNNTAVWATNTVQHNTPTGPNASGDTMRAGDMLPVNGSVNSTNGRYTFISQGDGNLVLYKNYPNHPRKALWATGTNGRVVDFCIMQTDGNLVLYDQDANPVWASGTNNHPSSRLVVQNDGNVVIYQPNNQAIWATNTVQREVSQRPLRHRQPDAAWSGTPAQPGDQLGQWALPVHLPE